MDEPPAAPVDAATEYALLHMDADGTLNAWNPSVRRVFGWERDGFIGQRVHLTFTPEDVAAGVPEREMATAAREDVARDARWHVRRDGSRFLATDIVHPLRDGRGRVHGYTKIVSDATARDEAERRLARKAALIDLSPDALFVQEAETSRILLWSRGAETTYGWRRAEALGCIAYELLRTECPVPRREILSQLERIGHWEGDIGHTRKDGRRIVVSSRWAMQGEGEGREVLEVNRDVTEQRRLEAEREAYGAQQARIAESLQRSLLMVPPPDLYPGLTVKAFYSGAEEDVLVGGDFFDIFAVSEDHVALVLGDATGKGLEAAVYTAEVKFALRALLREFPSPALTLTHLNAFVADKERLAPHDPVQCYMVLAVAVVNTRTGVVEAAIAGMEMPFLLRTTGEVAVLPSGGLPLGVADDTRYAGQRVVLAEGDLLVMSSDGLTEARHPAQRRVFFGPEGLQAAVREETARTPSLSEAAQAIVGRARAFAGGTIHDDVCLLLARRRPMG